MINLHNQDCMEAMVGFDDNQFDLAIVDPPYGIKNKIVNGGLTNKRHSQFHRNKNSVKWDITPSKKYFYELFRVSNNQIIWGSNYFDLPPTRCNLIWDKMQVFTGADFELAWTSFDKASKSFRMSRIEAYSKGKIHPTQKPVALYEWLLMNYAKEGDKILDTHLGSGSIAIACHNLGYDLEGYELDKDYYIAAKKRLQEHQAQIRMF